MSNNVGITIILLILLGVVLFIQCNRSVNTKEKQIMSGDTHMDDKNGLNIIGMSEGSHSMTPDGINTSLALSDNYLSHVRRNLVEVSATHPLGKIILEARNVTGQNDATILTTFVNGREAGKFSLFGLSTASEAEEGEKGLSFSMDITEIMKELLREKKDLSSLDIQFQPKRDPSKRQDIVIEKITLYHVKE